MEDAPETITVFANADIAILRSGKAKKNDPPIPADLAPISGNGKRVRKLDRDEEPVLLEPIRFRYSTEKIVEEPEETALEELAEAEENREGGEGKSRSRRRRRGKSDVKKPDQPKEQVQKEQPGKEQPAEAAETGDAGEENPKKPRRRSNHRRYRKPKQQNEG